ncbi:MAG: Jag N-terminal domain-containing protein, partial [Actinomycetota bacterium]
MEWVETTGKTIEEAKSIALDRLGVADEDAEFEILEEPKPGLFGRTRGEARVRARVKPRIPRAKIDRRDRRRRDDKRDDKRDESTPRPKSGPKPDKTQPK